VSVRRGALAVVLVMLVLPVPATVAEGGAVAEAAPGTPNGLGASAGATVRTRLASPRLGIVPFGRRAVVEGTVVDPEGETIPWARVEVLAKAHLFGAGFGPEGTVVTDDDGRFRYQAPVGMSRTLRFGYRAALSDVDFADSADVTLAVAAGLRLRTSRSSLRNGGVLRFSGWLLGPPEGSRKVIELQVRRGRAWQPFATVRLRDGRFGHSYRFTRTVVRTAYAFRARVRSEAGFPYATGHSQPVAVLVGP